MTAPTDTGDLAPLRIEDGVATLTMNRPVQRNALSTAMLAALHARLDELESTDGVRVLVLTGAGRAFCAGMDLKEVHIKTSGDAGTGQRLLASLARLTVRLRRLPAVTVARINGAAIGGGCGLVCVCDIALAHEGVKLGFPEVDLGLCPAVVAPWVVRKLGPGRARRVLLTGGLLTPAEAHRLGLVDHLASDEAALDDAVGALTKRLGSGGGAAMAQTKALLNELDGSLDEAAVLRGAEISARVLAGPEAQHALGKRLS